ncbi:hypothetical protein PINS_up000373 [Pythium insidiosum]|nr:hypothetical protein PINS_up000373 [Pythium insidiosum]
MVDQVLVQVAADAPSRCSTATLSAALSARLRVPQGTYVRLRVAAQRPRVYRVSVDAGSSDNKVDSDETPLLQVNQWPMLSNDHPMSLPVASPMQANLSTVSPARVRAVQFIELAPATLEPPKLSLPMARVLLQRQILHDPSGVLRLQLDGISYGDWQFRAFFRGHMPDVDDLVGIVTDETMIMIMPFASSPTFITPVLQDIGAHGQPLRQLLSLALSSPRPAKNATDDGEFALRPKSIILHGPSGAGKTTTVRLITNELRVNLLTIDCSILATPHFRVEDVFTAAIRVQPAIVLLEDLELMFPRALDETKYKLICRFIACLDRIRASGDIDVAVVGNVTTIQALNPKIRQVFEELVLLEVPQKNWSIKLFESLLPHPDSVPDELKQSVAIKYGQRPSNIVAIARQLTVHLGDELSVSKDSLELRRLIDKLGQEVSVTAESSLLHSSVPNVTWDDIGGLKSVKQSLMEMVVWPLERPDVFIRMGISPPRGMLLHGPPGTGKTLLAKAAARASGCNFLNVAASDLMKAEFGESEKAITKVFDTARALSPCMIFIDEFQSLFGSRSTAGVTTSRMISQLLMEMDAINAIAHDRERKDGFSDDASTVSTDRVFVLAATNALSAIDPAFMQPGRFENVLFVGLPNSTERHAIFELQRRRMPWNTNVDVESLVKATEGANAASIVALCQAAAMQAMQRQESKDITMAEFASALELNNFDFGGHGDSML